MATRKPAKKKPAKKKPAAKKGAKKPAARKGAKKPAARRGAKKRVEAVPSQYGTVTPHLIVSPCVQAIEFYAKAFGAKLTTKMEGPGGLVMHAEMKIGDSMIMLADEMPPMPGQSVVRRSPKSIGATTAGIMLYVKDADAAFERAVAAGATGAMPVTEMFWGDRYGQVEDPFGHVWAVATHVRDVSEKEMRAAMEQMMAAQGAQSEAA